MINASRNADAHPSRLLMHLIRTPFRFAPPINPLSVVVSHKKAVQLADTVIFPVFVLIPSSSYP